MGESNSEAPPPQTNSGNETSPQNSRPSRFRMLVGLAASGAALLGLKSRTAEAQPLFPMDPPKPLEPAGPPKPQGPTLDRPSIQVVPAKELTPKVEPSPALKAGLEKKTGIVDNLLVDPGEHLSIAIDYSDADLPGSALEPGVSPSFGVKVLKEDPRQVTIINPSLKVALSPSVSDETLIKDASDSLCDLMLESNQDKPLVEDFAEVVQNSTGINLDTVLQNATNQSQQLKWSEISSVLGFEKFQQRKGRDKLKKALFKSLFITWLDEPESVEKIVAKARPESQPIIANMFLEVLKKTMDCAKPGFTLKEFGVDRNSVDKLVAKSENFLYKQYFDKKV